MAIFNINAVIPSINDFEKSAPIGVSPLGTPVFDDITFPAGDYINSDGNTVSYQSVSIQSAGVIVSQAKNIIKTKISGRNGTVKEYNSLDDYHIRINAKMTELLNIFPADQLSAWMEIAEVRSNVPVVSKLLNQYFGIDKVVVESFDVAPIQGSLNELDINISLLSDEDIDLNMFLDPNIV